jgi:hypothetical protein
MENPWPRKPHEYSGQINLAAILEWIKKHRHLKLHDRLMRSRIRYRRALHLPLTEEQLYYEQGNTD